MSISYMSISSRRAHALTWRARRLSLGARASSHLARASSQSARAPALSRRAPALSRRAPALSRRAPALTWHACGLARTNPHSPASKLRSARVRAHKRKRGTHWSSLPPARASCIALQKALLMSFCKPAALAEQRTWWKLSWRFPAPSWRFMPSRAITAI